MQIAEIGGAAIVAIAHDDAINQLTAPQIGQQPWIVLDGARKHRRGVAIIRIHRIAIPQRTIRHDVGGSHDGGGGQRQVFGERRAPQRATYCS